MRPTLPHRYGPYLHIRSYDFGRSWDWRSLLIATSTTPGQGGIDSYIYREPAGTSTPSGRGARPRLGGCWSFWSLPWPFFGIKLDRLASVMVSEESLQVSNIFAQKHPMTPKWQRNTRSSISTCLYPVYQLGKRLSSTIRHAHI